MTRFDHALASVLLVEGVYSNRPTDPGGETVFGISRVYWPAWSGWEIVDALHAAAASSHDFIAALRTNGRLAGLVTAFYAEEFWNALGCNDLPTPVGEKLFEMAVNIDHRTAIKLLQIALGALNHTLDADGRLGPMTRLAVSKVQPYRLYDAMQAAHGGFYVGRRKPEYERGWIARALANDDSPEADTGDPV